MSGIEVRIIMELIGRPPAHLKETLQTLVTRMGSEKGVKLLDKKYFDPKKIKDTESLYSTFAEVEAELDSVEILLLILYSYSPSNIEIISPENLKISNSELNMFFNSLLERMHTHGAVLKRTVAERNILINQIEFLRQNLGNKVTELLMQNQNNLMSRKLSAKQKQPKKQAKSKPKKNKLKSAK